MPHAAVSWCDGNNGGMVERGETKLELVSSVGQCTSERCDVGIVWHCTNITLVRDFWLQASDWIFEEWYDSCPNNARYDWRFLCCGRENFHANFGTSCRLIMLILDGKQMLGYSMRDYVCLGGVGSASHPRVIVRGGGKWDRKRRSTRGKLQEKK